MFDWLKRFRNWIASIYRSSQKPAAATPPGPSVEPVAAIVQMEEPLMGPPLPPDVAQTMSVIDSTESTTSLRQPFPLERFNHIFLWANISVLLFEIVIAVTLLFFIDDKIVALIASLCLPLVHALYLWASFVTIKEDEIGARIYFGKPINNLSSGWAWIPLFFCRLVVASKNVVQQEIPAEPELIWRGKTLEETMPENLLALGYRPPIRITFKKREEVKEPEPLDMELTTEVTPVVRWHINDLCLFIQKIGTVADAKIQFEDECVGFCNQELSKKSLKEARENLENTSVELQKAIEGRVRFDRVAGVGDWGIAVDGAVIKQIPLSHDLNTAIQSAAVEAGEAIGRIIKAKSKKTKLELKGQAKGSVILSAMDAETTGLQHRRDRLRIPVSAALAAKTATEVAGHGNMIIVGSEGYEKLLGLTKAVQGAFVNTDVHPVGAEGTKPEPNSTATSTK